jgi:hypothetical protein
VALAFVATSGVVQVQTPVAGLALIADPSGDPFFALAQFTLDLAATSEGRDEPGRVAVATFAQRVVVETFTALVAGLPNEVLFALALAVVVAGRPNCSISVAITSWKLEIIIFFSSFLNRWNLTQAFGELVVSSGAHVAGTSGEVVFARATSRVGITHIIQRSCRVAVTGWKRNFIFLWKKKKSKIVFN